MKENNQSNGVIVDARTQGIPKMLLLGLQHMFAMFGATILVPILVNGYFLDACGEPLSHGLTMSVTLFCAGFGTLFFHFCTKFEIPAFLGSSFAFLGGFATVANMTGGIYDSGMDANTKAAYACGGVVVAGLLYLILASIIKLVGVKRVMRYLPPVVTGPVIVCIGLGLAGSAVSNIKTNWPLALIALGSVVIFYNFGKGLANIIPILLGIAVSYLAAVIMNACGMTNADGSAILDYGSVASASWVGLPPFQLPKFDLSAILVMAPIAIAAMMEHVGDMCAISATVGKDFISKPGLHRTLMGDGLATSLSALMGGPANTTYGENTGVLKLTRVHDPRVIRLAAIFALVISFMPKISVIISTMPAAIIGGVSFMLCGMIAGIGFENMIENRVDLEKPRNMTVLSLSAVCGFGFSDGITFTIAGTPVTLTALAIAAIVGIVLNAILPGKDYEFGKNPEADQHRGIHM